MESVKTNTPLNSGDAAEAFSTLAITSRGEAIVRRATGLVQRIGPNNDVFCHDRLESITSTSTVPLSASTASLSASNTNLADGKS